MSIKFLLRATSAGVLPTDISTSSLALVPYAGGGGTLPVTESSNFLEGVPYHVNFGPLPFAGSRITATVATEFIPSSADFLIGVLPLAIPNSYPSVLLEYSDGAGDVCLSLAVTSFSTLTLTFKSVSAGGVVTARTIALPFTAASYYSVSRVGDTVYLNSYSVLIGTDTIKQPVTPKLIIGDAPAFGLKIAELFVALNNSGNFGERVTLLDYVAGASYTPVAPVMDGLTLLIRGNSDYLDETENPAVLQGVSARTSSVNNLLFNEPVIDGYDLDYVLPKPVLGASAFTVSLWVTGRGIVTTSPVSKKLVKIAIGPAWNDDLRIFISRSGGGGSLVKFSMDLTLAGVTETVTSAETFSKADWHHVEASYGASTLRLFVDGVLAASASLSAAGQTFGVNQRLMLMSGSVSDRPLIADVQIKNTVAHTAGFTAPTGRLSSPAGTSTCFITAPSPICTASSFPILGYLISASLAAPPPTLISVGHDSTGEQAAYPTAPSPLLAANGGANAKLTNPTQTLAATGTTTLVARATLTAPSPALLSTGTGTFAAGASLKAPSPNLVGYGGAVCSITLTGKALLQATGTTGGVAGVTLTCPLFELTTGATRQAFGSANLLCPSPELGRTAQAWLMPPTGKLTAIGTAVIAVSYEAYAVNLLRSIDRNPNNNYIAALDEVTHYTNYPFTHVVRYQGSYYGANSTGLYLLEGTTDDGAAIAFAVKTAVTDFKTPNKKTLASAYFSGRFGPASTISLHEGEKAPNTYSFTTPRGTLAQNHRQKFGKGTKGRYFALSVSGTGTCELDGIEPEVHQLTRRI